MLETLASQAAIALHNVRLYAELTQENIERRRAEKKLHQKGVFCARLNWLMLAGVTTMGELAASIANEVIQLVRSSPARVQWTQIVWFVNRHLTLSTAYSHLFAGYYLHDIGKQDVGFVAVWLNYRF